VHFLRSAAALAEAGAYAEQGELLEELMEAGLAVSACGKALGEAGLSDDVLRPHVERGSMKDMAHWAGESDTVVTF
jgi:sulfur relay (sulfurtransferase) complex TusBCD TusD component (DsrE family)